MNFIYKNKEWPYFYYSDEKTVNLINEIELLELKLKTLIHLIGIDKTQQIELEATITEVVKNFEIESVRLNQDDVRSSIIKKLGLSESLISSKRNIDGYVEATLDAIKSKEELLSNERLIKWHTCLFYKGRNEHGQEIKTGDYRNLSSGDMLVSSGMFGKEKIHFIAPSGKNVKQEMNKFIKWFNNVTSIKPMVKSAIAHFWFVTIHPFEDGNGRLSRIISDMAISKHNQSLKYYSISEQIQSNKNSYYKILEKTQKQTTLDITDFILWYLTQSKNALLETEKRINEILKKVKFWDRNSQLKFNTRQLSFIDKTFEKEIFNKINTSKYANLFEVSKETASRDLIDLFKKGVLEKYAAGGRETSYFIKDIGIPDEVEFGKIKQKNA